MASELLLGNIKPVGADKIVVQGKYVQGGYFVVATTTERDALITEGQQSIVEGSLCYCQADDKFYRYTGSSWTVVEEFTSTEKTNLNTLVTNVGSHKVEKDVPSNAVFTDTKPKYNGTTVTDETNIPEVKTSTWDAKQDAISDLATIREGATLGSTSVQPSALELYRTSSNQDIIDNAIKDRVTAIENLEPTWNAKSTVSVSSTGTATDEVQYITVNNTEYKLAGGSGTVTDVQVGGTSIVSSGVANLVTNSTYSATTNKVATMSDLPQGDINITLTSTSISDGTTTMALPTIDQTYSASSTNAQSGVAVASAISGKVDNTTKASASTLGLVKVGNGLAIDSDGVLSVSLTNANTQSF